MAQVRKPRAGKVSGCREAIPHDDGTGRRLERCSHTGCVQMIPVSVSTGTGRGQTLVRIISPDFDAEQNSLTMVDNNGILSIADTALILLPMFGSRIT